MSTIDSSTIVAAIIRGEYDDDGPTRVVQYTNGWGNETWGVTFGREDKERYTVATPFVQNPRIIWDFARDGYLPTFSFNTTN